MKIIAPNYYPCSCCIGWEIDIDAQTREAYRHIPGEFGKRLNASIEDGEVSSFRLGEAERCPMLNPNGLCDLITELGEEALCQICADHPRFRSFFADRTEVGLGMCCEEAARLILSQEEPMRLIVLENDGEDAPLSEEEAALLTLRDTLIALLQDRSRPIGERLTEALSLGGLPIPDLDWREVYAGLERLDPAWEPLIRQLDLSLPAPEHLETAFEQFTVYMLFRHLPGALEDDDLPGRTAFCMLSTKVLMALCAAQPACSPAECAELARMYSAEIEYSEENIAVLLDALWEDA